VRILLHEVPPVLRGILNEAAARHPSIEMIDGLSPQDSGSVNANVVLAVTADPHHSATARALLFTTQASRVALLTPAGRELVVYDLTSRPVSAVDLPASELLDAVCQGLSDANTR
jgi:hypothetical protein